MYALLDKTSVCAFFGGINPATPYRGIRQGRFPKPVNRHWNGTPDRRPKGTPLIDVFWW